MPAAATVNGTIQSEKLSSAINKAPVKPQGPSSAKDSKLPNNRLKLNAKESDKKNQVAPESTKSGVKKEVGDNDDDNEGEGEGQPDQPQEPAAPKVYRYFPPRRLPNPFEQAAQEQEKFMQARKDALSKYSNISKNRYKQDESMPLKYVIRPGNNSRCLLYTSPSPRDRG